MNLLENILNWIYIENASLPLMIIIFIILFVIMGSLLFIGRKRNKGWIIFLGCFTFILIFIHEILTVAFNPIDYVIVPKHILIERNHERIKITADSLTWDFTDVHTYFLVDSSNIRIHYKKDVYGLEIVTMEIIDTMKK
ncbi:MAG: hypothetical protein ABIP51_13145 [Bacteroidia bacterium]